MPVRYFSPIRLCAASSGTAMIAAGGRVINFSCQNSIHPFSSSCPIQGCMGGAEACVSCQGEMSRYTLNRSLVYGSAKVERQPTIHTRIPTYRQFRITSVPGENLHIPHKKILAGGLSPEPYWTQ